MIISFQPDFVYPPNKKQATSYKAACDCHNSNCDKSEFAGSPGSQTGACLLLIVRAILIIIFTVMTQHQTETQPNR